MTAVNADSEGDPSNESSATPGVAFLSTPLLEAEPGANQVTLSWTSILRATSYNIYRSTRPGQEEVYRVGVTGGTRFTDTSVTSGTTYYYIVTAANTDGEGRRSNEASATP